MSAQIKVKRLNSQDAGFKETLLSSLSLPMADDEAIDASVAKILLAVKENGDSAVLDFTKQFDRLNVTSVSELEIAKECFRCRRTKSARISREAKDGSRLPFLGI
jgi:histidinol dehydrogenase